MNALSIAEFLELKEISEEKFGVKLHLHDACGAQYISLEEKCSYDFIDCINEYLSSKRLSAAFAEDRLSFIIKGI